jgi:heme oxygenase
LHQLSERSGVMGSLLAGRLGRNGYVALMRNLHAIYEAMETALDRHAHEPAVAALIHQGLRREAALAIDLDTLCGPGWRERLPLAPATQAYVGRLQALADDAPHLLVAHAYVRYLGDLHGGQMLKRLVARSLAAAGDGAWPAATHFYEFGKDDEVLALRQAFRAGLARIVVDAAAADHLVAEARWAFERHVGLFNELAAVPQPAHPPTDRASA